ncbi:MAG TPA: glycerol-3-phosphate responsive antiterminator [Symbiobacteriaceae bacterium]
MRSAPIIPAVRDPRDLPAALASPQPVVFLLATEINNVVELVRVVRGAGKDVFVHFDLVSGLGKDQPALGWLAGAARPSGVITTRSALLGQARSLGLVTIQRTFMVDSQSMQTTIEQTRKMPPDFLEAMPAIAPEGIRHLSGQVGCPVIAGGLVRSVPQVKAALASGAIAVSTSCEKLWTHEFRA